jgi:hypothetical protein
VRPAHPALDREVLHLQSDLAAHLDRIIQAVEDERLTDMAGAKRCIAHVGAVRQAGLDIGVAGARHQLSKPLGIGAQWVWAQDDTAVSALPPAARSRMRNEERDRCVFMTVGCCSFRVALRGPAGFPSCSND